MKGREPASLSPRVLKKPTFVVIPIVFALCLLKFVVEANPHVLARKKKKFSNSSPRFLSEYGIHPVHPNISLFRSILNTSFSIVINSTSTSGSCTEQQQVMAQFSNQVGLSCTPESEALRIGFPSFMTEFASAIAWPVPLEGVDTNFRPEECSLCTAVSGPQSAVDFYNKRFSYSGTWYRVSASMGEISIQIIVDSVYYFILATVQEAPVKDSWLLFTCFEVFPTCSKDCLRKVNCNIPVIAKCVLFDHISNGEYLRLISPKTNQTIVSLATFCATPPSAKHLINTNFFLRLHFDNFPGLRQKWLKNVDLTQFNSENGLFRFVQTELGRENMIRIAEYLSRMNPEYDRSTMYRTLVDTVSTCSKDQFQTAMQHNPTGDIALLDSMGSGLVFSCPLRNAFEYNTSNKIPNLAVLSSWSGSSDDLNVLCT